MRKIGISLRAGLNTALLLTAVFGLQSTPAQAQSRRMVFAHYMVTNQDYQDNSTAEAKVRAYMKEIQQAHRHRRFRAQRGKLANFRRRRRILHRILVADV